MRPIECLTSVPENILIQKLCKEMTSAGAECEFAVIRMSYCTTRTCQRSVLYLLCFMHDENEKIHLTKKGLLVMSCVCEHVCGNIGCETAG